MGNNIFTIGQSNEGSVDKYLSTLDYIMKSKDLRFGQFKIYKMKEKPYQYIMCKKYCSMTDDPTIQSKKQKYMNTPVHKNIIAFQALQLKTVQQKCGKHLQLTVCCRYYYYSLEEFIQKKLKKHLKFAQQEILYIGKTLVSLYESFHNIVDKQYGIFRNSNLFLTPEGFIKIYPWIQDWKGQFQVIQSSRNRFFLLSPEKQVDLKSNREKKDFFKNSRSPNDILDIGVVLLSLIFISKESDYRTAQEEIRTDIIRFILNSYHEPEYRTLNIFRNLLKGIFQFKWDILKIKQQLEHIQKFNEYKNAIRIKIISNDNQDSNLTLHGDETEKQRSSRLKMIPSNQLVPGRISCYSSRTSNLSNKG